MMNEFLDKISAILEAPITVETRFREVEGWSSLMAFGILVTLENDYKCQMDINKFQTLTTIAELARAAGIN